MRKPVAVPNFMLSGESRQFHSYPCDFAGDVDAACERKIRNLLDDDAPSGRKIERNHKIEELRSSCIRTSVSAENSVPKEMNHRKIAAGMSVVDEMLFLFASEPRKAQEPRPLHVKFLVEEYMRIK